MIENINEIVREGAHPIQLPGDAGEQYFAVARFFMKITYDFLNLFQLAHHKELFIIVYAIIVFAFSFGVGLIIQWITVWIFRRIAKNWKSDIYDNLVSNNFFTRVFRIIPAILFLIFIQFTLISHAEVAEWLTRLTVVYLVILVAIALCTLVDVIWIHINNRENKRKLPLKGIVSLTKGIIWIIALIIVVALLADKSPASLLAGVGAFAAVLMLIFKDSILGVVAGVQLSENDSLHVGDWIKIGDADGIVQEVTLTQVKIENWDKTVTTVPPYSLVSSGFTNYRSMQESGTRRVERSYLIDSDTVIEATEELLEAYAKIPLIADWIAKKRAQKAAGKIENVLNSEGLADGSIETNLGIFRAYMNLYLQNHPHVSHVSDNISATFVTTLPQTSSGIPLQLYFFTSTSSWVPYEGISASIFEHIAVMMKYFNLRTYEFVSSSDIVSDSQAGKAPVVLPPQTLTDNNTNADKKEPNATQQSGSGDIISGLI